MNQQRLRSSTMVEEQELSPNHRESPLLVSLLEILTGAARRKWTIAIITCLAAFAGIAYSLLSPVKFTATTKLLTPTQTPSTAVLMMNQLGNSGLGSLSAAAAGGFGLKSPNDVYIGLLRVRPIEEGIIKQFKLIDYFHVKDMTAARKELEDNTSLTSDKSQLITLSFTDKDKARAAEIANAYTEQLRILTQSLALTEASQRRLFYESQLRRAKEEFDSAELAFQRVQQTKGLVNPDAQARALIARLTDLRAQAAAKQVELQALRSYSTERNPETQLVENQLASLREQADQLEERTSAATGDRNLTVVAGASLEYLRSQHEVQYRQTILDLLMKQYDASLLDEAKQGTLIQVVESAVPPERKSSPHRLAIVTGCSLLGFLVACVYIIFNELVRRDFLILHALKELRSALVTKS
jgi:tyrosine-protein kinase Etk/Wzc